MAKDPITYRDIIYFNADKIQSILAQVNRGVVNTILESEGKQNEKAITLKTSKILEFLGLPISPEGGFKRSSSSGLQEERTMHDFALTLLLDSIIIKDASNWERTNVGANDERQFIKVRGNLLINDYAELADTIGMISTIDQLLAQHSNSAANEQKPENFMEDIMNGILNGAVQNQEQNDVEKMRDFIVAGYGKLKTMDILNRKKLNFSGVIDDRYLRETSRNMLYKYGTEPIGEWEMVCQITKIPQKKSKSIQEQINELNNKKTDISKEKSIGPVINNFAKDLSVIHDLFASVNHPDIAVEPIAIYKNIEITPSN